MWYKVDWDKLVLLLLPTFLRKPTLFSVIKSLASPISSVHYKFKLLREANILKLSYNGQRCYLRKVLNDRFDSDLRRISIENPLQIDQDYIYTPTENIPVYLGIMYIEENFNYVNGSVDFLVNVPSAILESKLNEINATLDFYKLAGKSYKTLAI